MIVALLERVFDCIMRLLSAYCITMLKHTNTKDQSLNSQQRGGKFCFSPEAACAPSWEELQHKPRWHWSHFWIPWYSAWSYESLLFTRQAAFFKVMIALFLFHISKNAMVHGTSVNSWVVKISDVSIRKWLHRLSDKIIKPLILLQTYCLYCLVFLKYRINAGWDVISNEAIGPALEYGYNA